MVKSPASLLRQETNDLDGTWELYRAMVRVSALSLPPEWVTTTPARSRVVLPNLYGVEAVCSLFCRKLESTTPPLFFFFLFSLFVLLQ